MTTTTATRRRGDGAAGLRDVLRIRIELWMAVAFMALAFGAGMAVRVAATNEPASTAATTVGVDGTGIVAPPLTDQQIQQGLPSGHPDLSGGGTGGQEPATGSASDDGGEGGTGSKAGGGDSTGSP